RGDSRSSVRPAAIGSEKQVVRQEGENEQCDEGVFRVAFAEGKVDHGQKHAQVGRRKKKSQPQFDQCERVQRPSKESVEALRPESAERRAEKNILRSAAQSRAPKEARSQQCPRDDN